MRVSLESRPLERMKSDLLVVPVFGEVDAQPVLKTLDRLLGGRLSADIARLRFQGLPDNELVHQTHAAKPARDVLLVGCGDLASPRAWYRVADIASRKSGELHASRTVVLLGKLASAESVAALAEGLVLAGYRFTRFRSKPDAPEPLDVRIAVEQNNACLRLALSHALVAAQSTCYARDLANTPGGTLPPQALARAARGLAGGPVRVRVHGPGQIQRRGMGALLGVAAGSAQKPAFIELLYRPARSPRRRIALVGKGITFDSGGLSLKNAESMQSQKRDMAGAAVVLGVFRALPRLGLPIEVRGYVPAAENMPGSRALRPGDVLRSYDGRTIEVLNTDAEGRLVLADALAYAAAKKPDVLLDFATLTAAVRAALGSRCAAIMGNDPDLVRACIEAGRQVGETLWELPLLDDYRHDIDSRVADLKNVGEGQAGTIIGGLFLREFVAGVNWAHIDFSSTVMSEGYPCHPKGASGFGVRTALRYLQGLAES